MRKFAAIISIFFFFTSCDDGDIIITNFDFESEDLSYCESGNTNLLYKIDNEAFESLSLSFAEDFEPTTPELEDIEVSEIVLNSGNRILYRTYGGEISPNYFCNAIPPTSPEVIEEYYSTGGIVIFSTFVTEQDDEDGVLPEDEDLNEDDTLFNDDTDLDEIPDFLDIDDDNDGVKTSVEIVDEDIEEEIIPDTDADGVFDYLDPDDDGDGVLTINEDADLDADPRNDDVNDNDIPDYLDPTATSSYEAFELPPNIISREFRTVVRVNNLTLSNGTETITQAEVFEFGVYDIEVQYEL